MSNICVYLQNIEPYLKQWFIHEHGGEYPVSLVRGSVESCMLKQFIEKRNEEEATNIDERTLAIYIPTFKDKDPRTYFYLPDRAFSIARYALKYKRRVHAGNPPSLKGY